jgi:glycosyltransferase involved in cell wall biosynthesis
MSSTPPRIAVVTTVHRWGDPRVFERQVATYLEWGCEVHVFMPPAEPDRKGWSVNANLHFHPLPESQGRLQRFLLSLGAGRRVAMEGVFDVVHFHDPELIPTMAFLAAFRRNAYFLYDIHEELPLEVESKPYLPPALRKPVALLARGAWRWARLAFEGFAPATEAIATHWPPERTRIVHNYPKSVYSRGGDGVAAPDPNRLLFIGALTELRGIREALGAVRIVRERFPAVQLDLVGPINDTSLAPVVGEAVREGWCTHTPWLAPEELAVFSSGAGVGLVPYLPQPDHLEALPTKIFEYMAMGIPILASDFRLWRGLIQETGIGRVARPETTALAQTLCEMLAAPEALEQYGARGREAYRRGYRWETERENLRWHLERAMRSRSRA